MYYKTIKIKGLENVRLRIKVILDTVNIFVDHKKPSGFEWHEVLYRKFFVTLETYNLENIILESLEEYAKMKIIEDHVINDIESRNIKELELPSE
jgi:hypothetical protein